MGIPDNYCPAHGGCRSAARDAIYTARQKPVRKGSEERVTSISNSQKDLVSPYVNFMCPQSSLSALMFATCDGTVDMVRELLAWGANPNYIWKRPPPDARFPFINGVRSSRLSALSLAITTSSTTADDTPGDRSLVALERVYFVKKRNGNNGRTSGRRVHHYTISLGRVVYSAESLSSPLSGLHCGRGCTSHSHTS